MRNEQNRNRNSVERRMETERETVKYSNSNNKKFNSQRISLGQTRIHIHASIQHDTHIHLCAAILAIFLSTLAAFKVVALCNFF